MKKTLSLLICSFALHFHIQGNLKNPTVAQGTASIENINETTCMITLSEAAFIFWEDFSISENETAIFSQPSSQSLAIMEVIGNKESEILGTIKSNGSIFLVSPHGVLIGENGYVDSYGFLASALPTCPCPLFDGEQDIFMQGGAKTSVINHGRIKAWENNVYLLGYQILNNGVIDAPRGTVAVAAGQDLVLHPSNGHKIGVFPSSVKSENEETGIDNSGVITGNRIELKADGNVYGIGIRHSGLLGNLGIKDHSAETFLTTEKGSTVITGAVSSENLEGSGGNIHILGEQVFVFENSTIDASGNKGGGNISIGTSRDKTYPGVIESKWVFIDEGTSIMADAIEEGGGGNVLIRSEEAACFHGAVSACGGENSGNGGVIEISAKNSLEFQGEADIMAPYGTEGMISIRP
jgi:filamentous hemagglutinin family protein